MVFQNEQTSPAQPATVSPTATLLALGGASWPKTGSDAAWVPLLRAAGVVVHGFAPSNCGAEIAWSDFFRAKVGRAPLKNIALAVNDGPPVSGELLLTDYGLEGTPAYALTPQVRAGLASGGATFYLNLKPDLPPAALLAKLQAPRGRASLADFLKRTLHLAAPVPTLLHEVQPDVSRLSPAALADLLTRLPLPIRGLRPLAEAISSAGGIALNALTDHLMLRARPGTFVAGEMLDWEAPTGGYLLQGCFSTGAWAARGMLDYLPYL